MSELFYARTSYRKNQEEVNALNRYLDKVPTLALLTLGGLSREELLSLPNVAPEDIDKARKLLHEKDFSIGSCERCKQITWLSRVQLETDDGQSDAKLCIRCEKIYQAPQKR